MKYLTQYIVLSLTVIFIFSSCIQEYFDVPGNEVNYNGVEVELFTRSNEFKKPVTRATANEYAVERTPWVLVFEGSGDNAVFKEASRAYTLTGINNKTFVKLQPTTNPCRLLILANLKDIFYLYEGSTYNEYATTDFNAKLSGKQLSEVCSTLFTGTLANPQTVVPFLNDSLTMSYLYEATGGITAGMKIQNSDNTPLELTRNMAKVIVENQASNFQFHGITFVKNVSERGLIHRLNSTWSANVGLTDYKATTGNIADAESESTVNNPIYLYETKTTNNTYIIIKGLYQKKVCYYKMALVDNNRNAINILRNNKYVFTITKADCLGHDNVSEAINAPAYNTGIHATLLVTNESAYETEAFDDYYLSVSNSAYITYSNEDGPFDVFSFLAYKNTGTVSGYINLWGPLSLSDDTPREITTTNSTTTLRKVKLKIDHTFDWDNEENYMRYENDYYEIRLGNLKKSMRVRREAAIPPTGKTLVYYWWEGYDAYAHYLLSGEVITGDDWIQLLPLSEINSGNTKNIIVEDGKLHIKILPNIGSTERTGTVYLSAIKNPGWNPEDGPQTSYRIKVDITQLGN